MVPEERLRRAAALVAAPNVADPAGLWLPTQVPLERSFGSWRIGALYLLSGIFGTMVSVIFLPEVLSVGASASVFGLIGACWADVALNFCARGTLRGAKGHACSLLLSTLINVCIGLTPFIDNFMHMGGLVAGLVIGGMHALLQETP